MIHVWLGKYLIFFISILITKNNRYQFSVGRQLVIWWFCFLLVFEGWYIPTVAWLHNFTYHFTLANEHFVWAFKPMSSIILHADHCHAFAYLYIEHFLSFDFLYFIQKIKYLHENVKFVYVKTEMCKVDRNLKRHSLLYAKYPIQRAMALAVTDLSSTNTFIFNVKLIFITIMDVIMNYIINFSTFS